jgi:hypothetical protein
MVGFALLFELLSLVVFIQASSPPVASMTPSPIATNAKQQQHKAKNVVNPIHNTGRGGGASYNGCWSNSMQIPFRMVDFRL